MELKNILIIEDSEADQYLTKKTIQAFDPDINIYQAQDGQEALELIDTLDVTLDLIFLDINMPVMNGLEFLDVYSTHVKQCSVVVMLTSSDQQRDREYCSTFECVKEYLIKPLETDDLVKIKNSNFN